MLTMMRAGGIVAMLSSFEPRLCGNVVSRDGLAGAG